MNQADIESAIAARRVVTAQIRQGWETAKKKIKQGPVPIDTALDIVVPIAQGLSKAHRPGSIHRDIKPAYIVLTQTYSQMELISASPS